jgi:hypothetical protein
MRGRSTAKHGVPTRPKRPEVEITQARNLDIDGVSVGQRSSDLDTRHDDKDDCRLDRRGLALLRFPPAIR